MNLKEIAAQVRKDLKAQLPAWKFSVRVNNGLAIRLALVQGPYEVGCTYAQLNHYTFLDKMANPDFPVLSGITLTPIGWQVMWTATHILAKENWDKSDIQSDYFCCNYYMHVQIGDWDRPYTVKEN